MRDSSLPPALDGLQAVLNEWSHTAQDAYLDAQASGADIHEQAVCHVTGKMLSFLALLLKLQTNRTQHSLAVCVVIRSIGEVVFGPDQDTAYDKLTGECDMGAHIEGEYCPGCDPETVN